MTYFIMFKLFYFVTGIIIYLFIVTPSFAAKLGFISEINKQDQDLTKKIHVEEFAHNYDSRLWLGQSTSHVCHNLDTGKDLLLVVNQACITPRYASNIQRPILFIPPDFTTDGCFSPNPISNSSKVYNSTENNSNNINHPQIIPLYLHGYQSADLLPALVSTVNQFENVLIVHVCDLWTYCGRLGVQESIEKIHDSGITTMQYSISIKNVTDFQKQFLSCMKANDFLSNIDRRLLVIVHTNISIISASIDILSVNRMLTMWTRVIYVVQPNYRVSDLDFLQIKDKDFVEVVRWQGESWLASVTQQRTVERYSSFWADSSRHFNPNGLIPNLAGILTTVSASQYYSRMITVNDPYQMMPGEVCSTSGDDKMNLISADLSKTLSCVDHAGMDVCSSYTVTRYDVDPTEAAPRPQTSGSWSSRNGHRKIGLQLHEGNLRGRKLRVGVIKSAPFLSRNQTAYDNFDGNDTTGLYQGVIPSMLKTLAVALNFRYEYVFPQPGDEYYGGKEKNGKWNGIIGMLERNEIDMIAADMTVSGVRQEIVDFTVPFFEDSLTILLPRSQFDKSPFTFLFPFSRPVWFCVIAAVAISGPLLYFFSRFSPYYRSEEKPNHFASLSESYMYVYGSIVSQGGQVTPDADSSRIFMVFWWLFGICTVATYSGNLIAFLTFPGKLKFVDNFDEFMTTSEIQPVVIANSYIEVLLRNSPRQIYKDAWMKIKQNEDTGVVDYYQEAVERVARDKFGFLGNLANMRATIAQDSLDTGPCHFALMRRPLEKVTYALGFRKGTNYAALFDKWIRRMSYSGLIDHWTIEELDKDHRPKRCQEELEHAPDEVRKVRIGDVVGVYIFLGTGCAFSCLLFLLERLTMQSGLVGRKLHSFFDKRDHRNHGITGKNVNVNVITLNNGTIIKPGQ